MSNIVVIIPSRLKAKRLPNKPLKLINKKEMILHVCDLAKNSGVGKVLVATPDKDIYQLIKKHHYDSFLSLKNHETGTDRVFEAYKNFFSEKPSVIINLQGDMPSLKPSTIVKLSQHLQKGSCDIATLASSIKDEKENKNKNVVKVITKDNIKISEFSNAIDFVRDPVTSDTPFFYHHIGIYGFTKNALNKYVNLKRSNLELNRNLEQMRALDNNMKIDVIYTDSDPLSVDTQADLEEIKILMEKNNV
ncbi:MAG: 3-deoxy-manno-octulosonate cytidylyltransferase [Pelagibacteraceae bacterium]|tara:strand:- start:417 stop:1160 length:744 start_codon:yes stop_codon:yes gene_type:complete